MIALGERVVVGLALRAGLGAREPAVEQGAPDLDALAEPLHLEGVLVVGNELEAAHQVVSPAKYCAAARKISRLVASVRSAASSSTTWARNRTSSSPSSTCTAAPCRPRTATPAALIQTDNVASVIPRSPAILAVVAPSVTR